MDIKKKHMWMFCAVLLVSVAVKKKVWWHGPFLHLVLLKLTDPGWWRLYFGVLSRQISFWTFLDLQLTILACKLYESCACCVNIKFRVHVYGVFVWISLDSLIVVAVSVCCFSFASVTICIAWIKFVFLDVPVHCTHSSYVTSNLLLRHTK